MKCHLQGLKNEIISAVFLVKLFFFLSLKIPLWYMTDPVVHLRLGRWRDDYQRVPLCHSFVP